MGLEIVLFLFIFLVFGNNNIDVYEEVYYF